MPNVVISKLAVHCLGPQRDNYRPFLERINGVGRQLAFTDCHDDYGAGSEAAQFWPTMLNIGDIESFKDSFDIDVLREKAAQNPHINAWQLYNEIAGIWAWQADQQIAIMNQYGSEFRFVLFNVANGGPPYPEEDGDVAYSNIARACKVAKAGGHMLGLHEYGTDFDSGHTLFRYRRLVEYLQAHDALCPIVITEAGPNEGQFIGITPFVDWCKRYDTELMKDSAIVGCALWTLGGGGWQKVNFEAALPEMAEYIATVPDPNPVVPPEVKMITGIHSREAGGDLQTLDMTTVTMAKGRLNGMKFTSQDARNNHGLAKSLGLLSENSFVRMYCDFTNEPTIPDAEAFVSRYAFQEYLDDDIHWVEFLNEPNVGGKEWKWTMDEFTTFAKACIAVIRTRFPSIKIISPGLSPSANTPTWDAAFASSGLYVACDGIGAHSYGQNAAHIDDPDQMRYYRRFASRLTGAQKIWITEVSLKGYTLTPYQVGQLYGQYASTLEDYVAGAYFFILQGPSFAASGEEWVSHQDIAKGLGDYVAPVADRELDHWLDLDTNANLGTDNPLTLAADRNWNVRAVTRPKPIVPVTYTALTSTDGYGVVTGGGTYTAGAAITLTWSPA